MPDIYKTVLNFGLGDEKFEITSLVMDKKDFMEFCDEIEKSNIFEVGQQERAAKEAVDRLREAGMLPMMSRGTKTQVFFDKYDVKTDKLSACVRGTGRKIAEKMLRDVAERN